ncbi:MAG: tetratricopeptide repeat protein [Vicingaceae bacterium]|nr:tetratricopeptide repeat protein [Vicingaceae bacterium]
MGHLQLYITISLLFLTTFVRSQVNYLKSVEETNNELVEEAFRARKEGRHEDFLKQLLNIVSSDLELSLNDSVRVNHNLAASLKRIGDFESAIEYAKKYIELATRINGNRKVNYFHMMSYFNAAEQYDSSIHYMKQGVNQLLSSPKLNKHLLVKNYNNIGYTYYLNKQLDSAEIYYKKVLNYENVEEDYAPVYGIATGNLGQLYFGKGEFKKSLAMFKVDAELTRVGIPESYNSAMVGQAECYYQLGKYNKAKSILSELIGQNIQREKTRLRAFKLMAKVCRELNDFVCSSFYLEKYIQLNDIRVAKQKPNKELTEQLSRSKVKLIEKDLVLAKNKVDLINKELKLTKSIQKVQKFKTQIFIVTSILSLILILILFVYFKNRQKKNKAINELRNELFKKELTTKKKDLNNVVTNLSYKRKFIDDIQNKLKGIQQESPEKLNDNLTLLIREFNSYKEVDKSMALLQENIDKVNLSFFLKLSEKFPLLTTNEIQMCGLFTLNLSSKDIAIIRNVTPEAIKKARYRIRKKLSIEPSQNITTFLNSF